jgi:outer membrane receptor for ferrienterochelin and colicins
MSLLKLFIQIFIISSFLYPKIIISGHIINFNTKEGISDVNIYIKKSLFSTTSLEDGTFNLEYNGNSDEIEIIFDHIAYEAVMKKIYKTEPNLKVKMKEVILQLDDVVVTSMRNNYLLRDVPVNTEVIGSKYIRDSGAITVSELLEQRSGVTTDTNVDGGSIFKLLGLDSRYILILKDGQPITGRFNNRVDLNHISLAGVEKIEISKGPGSAIYGTEAMGGVINIVSRRGKQANTFNSRIRTTTFSNNLNNIASSPIGNIFSMGNSLGSQKFYVNSDLTIQTLNKGQQFEYINSDQINKYNFDSNLIWVSNSNRHEVNLGVSYFGQDDSGATKLSTGMLLYTNSTNINRKQFSIRHKYQLNNSSKIIQSFRQDYYSRDYTQTSEFSSFIEKDLTKEENSEYEFIFFREFRYAMVNAGLEISNPIYTSDRIQGGEQRKKNNAIFFQQDWNLKKTSDLVIGMRVDEYGDTIVFSPRLAYAFSPNKNLKYRFAYGHGFRAPSLMETLINWDHVQFNYQVLGNPDLKPESSKGFTLGFEYSNQTTFQISNLIYHNKFRNLIEDYVLEAGKLSYYNINKATFTGIETLIKYVVNNDFSIDGNLNLIRNLNGEGEQIPNTVPISVGVRLSYQMPIKGFEGSLGIKGLSRINSEEYDPNLGLYTSTEKVNPYAMVDLQIKYNINRRYSIVIGSKNIGNHINNTFGPYIGRIGYIELLTQ